jgi:4'-phosphopantetheinyl transferase
LGHPVHIVTLPGVPPLRPGQVDLWTCFYETASPEALVAYERLLTPDERARQRRFHFERDRTMFLATRALARTALSAYADVAPADWRFALGTHGKPRIASPLPAAKLSFNLSNTSGLVICGVSLHEPLGVDAEDLHRAGETLGIADRFFSPSEVRALRGLPAEQQRERFFALWTLKESYIKARGLGLSLPLDQFSFSFGGEDGEGGSIDIAFDPRLADAPARWQFVTLRPSARHRVAVAVDAAGAPLSLRVRSLVL